jgi:electron transfer flavoprotein beta subunit
VNILVLCKQVPDTESKIKLAGGGTDFDREGIKWVLNPYDEFAVEEALKVKETGKAAKVTVVGLGPDRIVESVRTALAMGADDAIHIKTDEIYGDSFAVAKAIAAALEGVEYGLILAGKQALDDDSFAVPGMLAELLGIAQVNVVSKLEVGDDGLKAWRDVEGGAKEVVESSFPCLITTTKGLNEPRYASLPGIMKAKRKPVDLKEAAAAESKTEILGWTLPEERQAGQLFAEGELADRVKEVVRLLREEAKVI